MIRFGCGGFDDVPDQSSPLRVLHLQTVGALLVRGHGMGDQNAVGPVNPEISALPVTQAFHCLASGILGFLYRNDIVGRLPVIGLQQIIGGVHLIFDHDIILLEQIRLVPRQLPVGVFLQHGNIVPAEQSGENHAA
ncbi:hypothetical protein D3C75_654260 [compost metagenome]